MNVQLDISQRLRAARKAAGFKTLTAFFTAHKISRSTYHHHETGSRNIDEATLKKYAKLLKVDYDWLATGEGSPYKTRFDETRAKFFAGETLNIKSTMKKSPLISEKLMAAVLKAIMTANKKLSTEAFAEAITSIYSDVVRMDGSLNEQIKAVEPAVSTFFRYTK
jgi:transcriptional regulator with XRE-family HTH domain